ncbi:MAG TPA: TIGR01459 family HAD-type hydrolase [Caulobacteraceae bacterium]|nr:TIGR01459 family HAD-type hydrolase [Caulobacteraceae bacterium]
MVRLIEGLAELASTYRVLYCDVWGVIHDGVRAFQAPCAALIRWRREIGPVALISNSPRPCREVARQLRDIGVPPRAWSALVTSGDATRRLLAERAPGPAWRIGPDRDQPLYRGLGLRFAGLEQARFIACTGLNDDDTETPEEYREQLTRASQRGLEMVCANPDLVVQRGERLIFCGGALAQLYQSLGGKVVMAGKPFAPVYDLASAAVELELGRGVRDEEVLAIGDGLATDLAGARGRGLDALFIATGVHGSSALTAEGEVDARRVASMLARAGEPARFAMATLRW